MGANKFFLGYFTLIKTGENDFFHKFSWPGSPDRKSIRGVCVVEQSRLGSSTCCRRIYRISWQQQRQWQRQHELILGCSLILLQFLFENFIGNKAEQPRGRRQGAGSSEAGSCCLLNISRLQLLAGAGAIYALDGPRLLLPLLPSSPAAPPPPALPAVCV